jgi:hypothetical protein
MLGSEGGGGVGAFLSTRTTATSAIDVAFGGESATAEATSSAPPHESATAKIHSLLMLMGVLL